MAELRKDKGWSQEVLASKLNVTKDTISNYEREIREPDDKTKIELARLLGVSVDYLIGLIDIEISYDRGDYIALPKNVPSGFKDECDYFVDLLKHKYNL